MSYLVLNDCFFSFIMLFQNYNFFQMLLQALQGCYTIFQSHQMVDMRLKMADFTPSEIIITSVTIIIVIIDDYK